MNKTSEVVNWRLVKVDSNSSVNSFDMVRAIRSGVDVPGQTKVLYRSQIRGYSKAANYSWTVAYRQSLNSLDIIIEKEGAELWSHQWEKSFNEPRALGRTGLFAYSQPARFFDLSVQSLCII